QPRPPHPRLARVRGGATGPRGRCAGGGALPPRRRRPARRAVGHTGVLTLEICLSAPGKLFLSGEYAVLWGGTARLAGVGPRAWALGRTREDREVHLVLAEGRLVGTVTPLGVRWGSEPTEPFA